MSQKPKQNSSSLYSSRYWKSLRRAALERSGYRCEQCFGRGHRVYNSLSVDHIIPHRGDLGLFRCGIDGLQVLCRHCHYSVKAKQDRLAGLPRRFGSDGKPLNADHISYHGIHA